MQDGTHKLSEDEAALFARLLAIRDQQYSALVETERALKALNPAYPRRFLSRRERRHVRQSAATD